METNQFLDVNVVARTVEAPNATSLIPGQPCGADLPVWELGAHIDVLHDIGPRQYSLSGNRTESKLWRISTAHEESSGAAAKYFARDIEVADPVKVSALRNNFSLVEPSEYLFLAGGIGITSMLPTIDAAIALGRAWSLHYGIRDKSRYAFAAEYLLDHTTSFYLLELALPIKAPVRSGFRRVLLGLDSVPRRVTDTSE